MRHNPFSKKLKKVEFTSLFVFESLFKSTSCIILAHLCFRRQGPGHGTLGTLRFLRSSAWLASSMSVSDFTSVGSLTSVQSFVRLGPSLPLAAASQSRDLVSLKNFYLVGLAFFTYGKVRADSTMSILDHVTSESALFLRSFSRLDLALLAFDCSSIGFFISLRSLARLGFAVSITGLACIESFLLAFEAMHMGSSMFARSPARPDLAAFLVDTYQLGSVVPMHSFVCLESSLPVLDVKDMGSSLFLHSFARSSSTMSIFGLGRPGLPVFVFDAGQFESFPSIHSFS